ncbi:MAG: EamA family transporter [bacterium]|nr:EamA family transporter [bacterium]
MLDWQIIFCIWLVFTTAASLIYRRFAVKSKLNPLVSDVVRNALVSLPAMIAIAITTGDFVLPSTSILLVALLEATIGTAYGYFSFYAIKESDASSFTTLIKLSVIPVVVSSSLILGEGLTKQQYAGGALLLLGALLLGKVKLTSKSIKLIGLCIVLITAVALLSRYLVESAGLVTALLLSFGFGLLIKLPFTAKTLIKERKQVRKELPMIMALGVTGFFQVILFIWATDLAGNLSLVYSLAASKVVIVPVLAAIFLGEKDNLRIKISAASIAALGLIFI